MGVSCQSPGSAWEALGWVSSKEEIPWLFFFLILQESVVLEEITALRAGTKQAQPNFLGDEEGVAHSSMLNMQQAV